MQTAVLEKSVSDLGTSGLDLLARGLAHGEQDLFAAHSLERLIEAALEQLECDDTISPAHTDQLVDRLSDALALYQQGQEPWHCLDKMLEVYYEAREQESLWDIWTAKAKNLSSEEIRTEMWDSFLFAASLVESGKGTLVSEWLLEKKAEFEAARHSYDGLYVCPTEITMESQMCHHFLQEGIESWLQAIAALVEVAEHNGDVAFIVEEAEWAQRQLLAVQLYEAEASLAESGYFVHYN